MSARKSFAERVRAIAETERRQWSEVENLVSHVENCGIEDAARELADAVDDLRNAYAGKEDAMDLTGEDGREALATAWDEVQEAATRLADAADALSELHDA